MTTTRSWPVAAAGSLSLAVLRTVTLALHGGGVAPSPIAAGHAHATSLPFTRPARRTVTAGEAFFARLACAPSEATASVAPLEFSAGAAAWAAPAAADCALITGPT